MSDGKEKKTDVKLPEHVTVDKLKEYFSLARTEYAAAHRRAQKLDATDRGKLWEAVRAEFPKYQILPDTNFISYVKQNILAFIINVAIITLVVIFLPFSIFVVIFLPLSLICFTTTFICYPVIQKYIINPYYEERGETNPELSPVGGEESDEGAVFVDRGGTEKEIKAAPKAHGKVIK